MAVVKQEHIQFAALIELQVRKRALGVTPEMARALAVANFEEVIVKRCADIAERMYKCEQMKGIGSQIRAQRGEAEAAEFVKLFAWTSNLAKRIEEAILAGELPEDVKAFLKAVGEEI